MVKNHLIKLEEEAISIIRDTYANSNNPVVLYSIGKDSSVLLDLFKKAFYPINIPVPFLHIDTGWKFKEMISFRNLVYKKHKLKGLVYSNEDGMKSGVNPFNHEDYTDIMKTEALKVALNTGKYDFIYGGSRRDEEASRSKEKVLSHRDKNNRWDPINQSIEPWHLFNMQKKSEESFRVFPISNWTELNIWEYIQKEKIDIVPLYFAKKRKVVVRNKQIFLHDDNRFQLQERDEVKELDVRFRTLGCYPLTAGIESKAKNVNDIINELKKSNFSERSGRLIDYDKIGSMELKKREGYF
jgi:sulfate adenylyltransferase subunit 2